MLKPFHVSDFLDGYYQTVNKRKDTDEQETGFYFKAKKFEKKHNIVDEFSDIETDNYHIGILIQMMDDLIKTKPRLADSMFKVIGKDESSEKLAKVRLHDYKESGYKEFEAEPDHKERNEVKEFFNSKERTKKTNATTTLKTLIMYKVYGDDKDDDKYDYDHFILILYKGKLFTLSPVDTNDVDIDIITTEIDVTGDNIPNFNVFNTATDSFGSLEQIVPDNSIL